MKKNLKLQLAVRTAIGAGAGVLVIVLLSMLGGVLTVRGILPPAAENAAAVLSCALGGLTAALVSLGKGSGVLRPLFSCAGVLLLLLLLHALAFETEAYRPAGTLIGVGVSALAAVLLALRKQGSRRRLR